MADRPAFEIIADLGAGAAREVSVNPWHVVLIEPEADGRFVVVLAGGRRITTDRPGAAAVAGHKVPGPP